MKYKALYTPLNGSVEVIKVCNSKEEAINECVDYKYGCFSCDERTERRKGLMERVEAERTNEDGTHAKVKFIKLTDAGRAFDPEATE